MRGRVVAAHSREPIRRARVEIVTETGERQGAVYSDNDGRFEFTHLPAGRYTASAWKSGYVTATFGANTIWEPASVIALGPGQAAEGLELGLTKGAALSGRILDDAGEPLAEMQVTIGRAVPVNGQPQFQRVTLPAVSNDRGEYRVGGLPPGTFVIGVTGWASQAVLGPGDDGGSRPRSMFYPQTPFVSQARPVVVREGEEVGPIDVAFTADTLVIPTVSGRVIDPRGDFSRASLFAVSTAGGVSTGVRGTGAPVHGTSEFTIRLTPAEYVLTAQSDDMVATTRLRVDRSDVTGVDLVLAKGASIRGRMVFDGASPRPPEGFTVHAAGDDQPQGFQPFGPAAATRSSRVRGDGSFSLTNLIGNVELRVTPDARGWRPKAIVVAGRNVLDVPLDFKGGEDLRDVVITMTDRTASLVGTVRGFTPGGPGVPSVLVFPADVRQVAHRSRWVRPDQNGQFVVADLTPGEYLVALATEVDDLQWKTPAYVDRIRPQATRVTLGDGEAKNLSLDWMDRR